MLRGSLVDEDEDGVVWRWWFEERERISSERERERSDGDPGDG